jgi:hypothetical protein
MTKTKPVAPLEPHWFQILLALADRDLHGLAIMNDVLERTGGRMRLWPGMLYRALGRPFTRDEDESARPVAVLSDMLWTRKFARDPAAIGGVILLDRQPFTIVGVMPNGFTFRSAGS